MNIIEVVEKAPDSLYAQIPEENKTANPKAAAELLKLEYQIADIALRDAKRDAPVAGKVLKIVAAALASREPGSMAEAMQALQSAIKKPYDDKDLKAALQKGVELMGGLGFTDEQIKTGLADYYSNRKVEFLKKPNAYEFSGVSSATLGG